MCLSKTVSRGTVAMAVVN